MWKGGDNTTTSNKFMKEHDELIKRLWNTSPTKNIKHIAISLAEQVGTSFHDDFRRAVSRRIQSMGLKPKPCRLEDSENFRTASHRTLTGRRLILTYQQNQTPVNQKVWQSILTYAKHIQADIGVILGRHKIQSSYPDPLFEPWDSTTENFHISTNQQIHPTCEVLGEVNISPNSKYPLTGMEQFARQKTVIIGHPKLHARTAPKLPHEPYRRLLTTGAITVPNYSQSLTGSKAKLDHKYGFVVVELDGPVIHARQVEVLEDGKFQDLWLRSDGSKIFSQPTMEGAIFEGHYRVLDPIVERCMIQFCNQTKPKNVVMHDVYDGEPVNNHLKHDPIGQYHRYQKNEHLVYESLERLSEWLNEWLVYNLSLIHI